MEISQYFKSIIDLDEQPLVICDLQHKIIYMNPCAKARYSKSGGEKLIGKSLLDCHNPDSVEKIKRNIGLMQNDKSINKIFEVHSTRHGGNNDVYTAAIRDENGELIGYYEKFEDKNLYSKEN